MISGECPLCARQDETVLWQNDRLRVIHVSDPDYPAFCRVIWNAHVREMTDLDPSERAHLMGVVFTVESMLREVVQPFKVNLASLGNVVPHLHWHVIPRFEGDAHFPDPIWAARRRTGPSYRTSTAELVRRLAAGLSGIRA